MSNLLVEAPPRSPPRGQLDGMVLGVGVRNSTSAQVGNWRSMEQEHALVQKIERLGGTVRLFDEQGTSGRDMSKRPVLLDMLEMVERDELQGLAYYDVKRLTRNEYGVDGGIIAKRLVEAGAVLVTADRIYELWKDDSALDYDFQKLMSAHDIRGIRKTFWTGVFARAEAEPFFMGVPPTGYATEIVQVDRTGGTSIRRLPVKEPTEARMMAELTRLLDECYSLGDVARDLNRAGLQPLSRRQPSRGCAVRKGQPVPWGADKIQKMLRRPVYWGEPELGTSVDKKSAVWRIGEGRELKHRRPDLAYWTKAQVYRWREKFSSGRAGPIARTRKHDYPLRGVLACAGCGRALVGAGLTRTGDVRYWCPVRTDRAACSHPQSICQSVALRVLESILPDVWSATVPALAASAARQEADEVGVEDLRRELAVKKAQIRELNLGLLGAAKKPKSTLALIVEMEEEAEALGERLVRAEEREEQLRDRSLMVLAMSGDDPRALVNRADPGARALVYRTLVRKLRVRTTGNGRYARSAAISYETAELTGSTSGGTAAQLLSAFRTLLRSNAGRSDA